MHHRRDIVFKGYVFISQDTINILSRHRAAHKEPEKYSGTYFLRGAVCRPVVVFRFRENTQKDRKWGPPIPAEPGYHYLNAVLRISTFVSCTLDLAFHGPDYIETRLGKKLIDELDFVPPELIVSNQEQGIRTIFTTETADHSRKFVCLIGGRK